MIVDNRIN